MLAGKGEKRVPVTPRPLLGLNPDIHGQWSANNRLLEVVFKIKIDIHLPSMKINVSVTENAATVIC
jgi:hypothetical protein